MSTINQIQLPNGATYDFEDTAAREAASSKADKTLATTSTNGLMSAADKKAIDREFFRMLPKGGTHIPANADLNSIQYLKIGNYYNPLGAEAATMKNVPVGRGFMMYVLSPLSEAYDNESTRTWVYRLRIFVEFNGNGIFTQMVYSGSTIGKFSYDPWVKMTNSDDLSAVSKLINDHIANKSNPHEVTKAQVGLGNVANIDQSKAIKSITRNGTTFTATALDGTTTTFTQQDSSTTYPVATASADGLMSKTDKAKLDGIEAGGNVKSVNGKTGAVTLEKGDVGLGSVDNTKDVDKPISTAMQMALDKKADKTIATASADGLMSKADKAKLDGIEAGSNVKSVNGKTGVVTLSKADVGLGNVDNTKDADKPISTAVQTALDAKANNSAATESTDGLMSAADKAKLDGITSTYATKSELSSHSQNTSNPHKVTASQVGALPLSGGSLTGNLTAPSFQTGTGNANYFQCKKFRGEGDANTYYHAVDFGYAGHNQVDFYEYGGKYVFHRHSGNDTVIGEINSNGFVGKVNGHTINADVPAGAKFTDTTYSNATTSAAGLMSSADKAKLDGVAAGADVSPIKTVKVNGTALTPDSNKAVNVTVPTLANNATTTESGMALDARMGKTLADQASQLAQNTAQIETAGTATSAHSAGEYVMISNALYKVTAAVAKGDAWTIGTNVTATNVGSEIGSLKSDLANKLYPVGSIYISANSTSPAELFGGTWEQIKDRFLLAAGDNYAAGSTGGEAQHTLTVDEMPSHSHDFDRQQWYLSDAVSHGDIITWRDVADRAWTDSSFKGSVNNSGGGQPHNNMPPYLAVYMWKRVS